MNQKNTQQQASTPEPFTRRGTAAWGNVTGGDAAPWARATREEAEQILGAGNAQPVMIWPCPLGYEPQDATAAARGSSTLATAKPAGAVHADEKPDRRDLETELVNASRLCAQLENLIDSNWGESIPAPASESRAGQKVRRWQPLHLALESAMDTAEAMRREIAAELVDAFPDVID